VTVPIEGLRTVALDSSHLQGAFALSAEADWNQTGADWKMMLAAGNAFGMVAPDGRLVASALTLPYGDAFGWISMVLVTPGWRNRGLAKKLLGRAIETLEQERLTPVLDSTPAGEHVYRPLGFVPHFPFRRWAIDNAPDIRVSTPSGSRSRRLEKNGMAAAIAYDRGVFGGDRGAILNTLLARSDGCARIASGNGGYLLCRDGRVARQIGPVCADSPKIAIDLLDRALAELTGPVIIDACDHQQAFADHLKALGFKPQRSFLRMAKGRHEPFGDPERMFALAGPELG